MRFSRTYAAVFTILAHLGFVATYVYELVTCEEWCALSLWRFEFVGAVVVGCVLGLTFLVVVLDWVLAGHYARREGDSR